MLFLLSRQRLQASFYLTLAGLLLMIGALVITLAVNVPIDVQIAGWTVDTLPAEWTAIRDRWEFYHGLRTVASIASLGWVIASLPPAERVPAMA